MGSIEYYVSHDKITKRFKRKTLVDEIKSILQQYPDDGQIFKEIIQNSEDAGASEVIFIYDKNDDRRKGLELSKEVFAKHQGPSLFAYNNARFNDDDWDGIISLGISKKAKDALKVGRFGLGFKSVFHLTDMPSIASGSTFAYLDPMEDTLGEEVSVLDMDPGKLAAVQKYDDFKAFHRLGKRFWKPNNSTDGAIFRFPLRQERSNLSSICYNQQRFERLMEKFMKEAYLTMIFLKHVKSIKIFSIEESSSSLREIYSVSISDQCNQQYQNQKKAFVDIVNARADAKAFDNKQNLDHELELVVSRGGQSSIYRYAISELFGYSGRNKEFTEMMEDEDLSYIPLIATAYPLTPNDPGGHIFSGLPIPLQSQRMNGMPVHVNGFFALGQDRKDLKWKTLSTDDSNDKTVNWNIHLIRELLPLVYANLIQFLIGKKIESEVVYQAWPLQQYTDSKWAIFLGTFYQIMINTNCIYIPWKDCWITPGNAYVLKTEEMKESQFKAIHKFLSMTGLNVASAPAHVMHNLTKISGISWISWINKSVVQKHINEYENVYSTIPMDEQCLVLSYAVVKAEDLKNMIGKKIIPLVNGNYFNMSVINSSGSTLYYLPTAEHGKELLTSEERIIDVAFFAADNQFLNTIKCIFREGFFNVIILENTRSMINAIRSTFPNHWQQSYAPNVNWPDGMISSLWLSRFSAYCRRNRIRFSELEGMPLIPVESNGIKELLKISKINTPIASNMNVHISSTMKIFLQNCGLWFVEHSMLYENMQNLHIEGYILQPTSENIFHQLERNCGVKKTLQVFATVGNNLRNEMCALIKEHRGKLPSICYDLPLFKGYKSSVYFSARNTIVVDEQDVPEIWNESYGNIVSKQETDINLAYKLQITFWSFGDVCKFIVDNKWHSLQLDKQISFSRFFLEKCVTHPYLLSMKLQSLMRNYIKILDNNGNVIEPNQLFQKTDQLESFFFGEHGKFPSDSYNMNILNIFGLKSSASITIQEVNVSIKMVNILNRDERNGPKLLEKVKAILKFIRENNLDRNSLVKDFPWIPVAVTTPRGYPENMNWLGKNNKSADSQNSRNYFPNLLNTDSFKVEYLANVYNETYQDIVGSVCYVIHPVISSEFNVCFNGTLYTSKTPTISLVIEHLKNVVKCYTDDEKGYFTNITLKIYNYLSKYPSQVVSVARSEGLQIWKGNGFVQYQKVLSSSVRAVPDLSPYFYVPPVQVLQSLGSILHQLQCNRIESDVYVNVLKKIAEKNDHRTHFSRDWELAFSIVKALAKEHLEICEKRKSEIFVPVEGSGLQLQPLDVCFYHDFDKDVEYRTSQSNNYILHRQFDKDLAKKLKVPNLVSKVLSGNKKNLFQPWGQSEPLTLKLKRLLEDYKDGLAIVKELIQNADDAGASEVKFLYDQRKNSELKGHLIDPQMKEWQGPALWVYNNQIFSEKDFENITKLNAGTKEYDTTKIGKFGLGFNSVYHLTDVPSFLSSDSLVIFDPHTKYLGEAVEKQPGIRIPITEVEKKEELVTFKDQFKVYHDVFGAKLDFTSNDVIQPYNGALFRLPLRTSTATARSEIKKMEYTEREMDLLLNKLKESLSTLILFTQNVSSIAVFKLADSSSSPTQHELLYSVKKNVENLSNDQSDCNILSIANEELRLYHKHQYSYRIPVTNLMKKVTMTTTIGSKKTIRTWINVSTIGSQDTFSFAAATKRHIPCGGISCQFQEERNESGCTVFKPVQLETGQMFCFLPLPIRNEIPIHVNGAFDISRDRQNLQFHNEDEKQYGTVNWNELLSFDISNAYYNLLAHLKELCRDATIQDFVSCFPIKAPSFTVSKLLLKTVLAKCIRSKDRIIPVRIENNTKWVSWNQLKVFNFKSTVALEYVSFLNWFFRKKGSDVCLDLPRNFKDVMNSMGFEKELNDITITQGIVQGHFLDSINDKLIDSKIRDTLLDDLLKQIYDEKLKEKLKETPCIPTFPNGRLRKPSELVLKGSKVANLYLTEDEVFPNVNGKHFEFLYQLGAKKVNLPWDMLLDRAKSIEVMQSNGMKDEADCRSKLLLSLIGEMKSECPENLKRSLLDVKFLKVLQKPRGCLFRSWFGEGILFSKPSCMYLKKYEDVCCSTALLCEDKIGKLATQNLQLNRKPSAAEMVGQAKAISLSFMKNPTDTKKYRVIVDKLYEELSYTFSESKNVNALEDLKNVEFVRTSTGQMVVSSTVFINVDHTITGYIHKLDPGITMNENLLSLMKVIGVREDVGLHYYISALHSLKEKYGEMPVPDELLKEILYLVPYFCECEELDKSKLLLPDSEKVLQEFHDLCYKDVSWLPDEEGVIYINDDIPRPLIKKLDVKSLSCESYEKNIENYDGWLQFGQNEQLTTRIKNLLQGYSEPIDVFKEMFQNADDSGATEIEFILDKRNHERNRVFSTKWEPLQGPALIVVNNGKFSEDDLKGIQSLGDGNKKDDPLSTGRYGVGFNSVYSITDCPVLLTNVEDVGDVMAIFDPHLKYAEGANQSGPGSMMKNARNFLKTYPDVQKSFLTDRYDSSKKTLFRLPLRDEDMAEASKVSNNVVNTGNIEYIFQEVRKSANHFLLFLSNIRSIYLKVIDKNGSESVQLFTAKSLGVSKKEEKKFKTFRKDYSKKLGDLTSLMNSDRKLKRKVCVQCYVDEKLFEVSHWNIIEQCGFSNMNNVPDSVKKMIQNKHLHLIPRGGIAKLSKETCCEICEDMELHSKRNFTIGLDSGHVFCTLPLAVTTGIPVLINGNFVLDYESRRCLWSNETDSVQRSWNNAILKSCVLPCYIEYLKSLAEEISGMYEEDEEDDDKDFEKEQISDIETEEECGSILGKSIKQKQVQQINGFYGCFPDVKSAKHSYWKYLTETFYKALFHENMELLAVHRNEEVVFCKPQDDFLEYDLKLPTNIYSKNDVTNQPKLLNILKSAFINTEKLPNWVSQNFKHAECCLDTVTPPIIRERLANMKDQILPLGEDTWNIEKTIFKNVGNVQTVLEFCLKDSGDGKLYSEIERIALDNIPLCLRANDILAAFSGEAPIFLSKFCNLFEKKKHHFLHQKVYHTLKQTESFGKHINQNCFKDFTLREFSNFLSECWGMLKCSAVPICFDDDNGVTESWLSEVWKYIVSCQTETEDKEKHIDLDTIKDFSLVLSQRFGKNYLLPIFRRKYVLYLEGHPQPQQKLVKVLRDFGCYEPVYRKKYVYLNKDHFQKVYPEDVHCLSIFGSLNSFSDTIESLTLAMTSGEQRKEISVADGMRILNHLQELLGNEVLITEDMIVKLRSLPLFENWNGEITNGSNDVVSVPNIPLNGMEKIENSCQFNFIKQSEILKELYAKLQFNKYEIIDFYLTFVLPNIDVLEDRELMVHIKFIKSSELLHTQHGRRIKAIMSSTKIFPSRTGERRICRELYNPNHDIFKLMQYDRDFPAIEYSTDDWLPFLQMLGLIADLSSEDFLRYAGTLEKEENWDKLKTVSELLCIKLKEENKEDNCFSKKEFLEKLCKINFILPLKIDMCLENISPSLNSTRKTICYRDSVSPKHKNLVWTTECVLSQYAVGKGEHWKMIVQTLGMKTKAKMGSGESLNTNSVIQNIKTITNNVNHLENKTATCKQFKTEELAKTYKNILISFYKYMQQRFLKEKNVCKDLVQIVSNFSCVLVDGGQQIDIPNKVFLKDRRILSPYLNKSDDSIGQFYDTLEKMGCFKDGSANNYIDVLKEIKMKSRERQLDPNELIIVKNAAVYLSECLQKNCEEINGEIYLPTVTFTKKDRVNLTKSNDCLYVDDFSMEERLQQFDKPLMMYSYRKNEKHLDVNSQIMSKLPKDFRPRELSQCITEELSCKKTSIKVKSDHISNKIKNRLTDPMFKEGLTRLFLHENHTDISVDDYLNGVEVHVLPVVKTTLIYDGKPIQNSDCERNIFMKHDENILHLYFDSSEESYKAAYEDVSLALLKKFGDILKENETIILLPKMLSEPIDEIEKLLDDHKIRRDETSKAYRSFGEQPKPGDPVPVDHHALLRQDLSCFQLDEYVGIDKIGEGNFFVYGIIKELDNNPNITERFYGVQTTPDADVIEKFPFYTIYKFERGYENEHTEEAEEELNPVEESNLIDVSDVHCDFTEENKHKTYDEIIEEVRTVIGNLRGKPAAERKIVQRRLYFAWHPDKHPKVTKELATKVFQFLQNELKKLDGSCEKNYEMWNENASQYQRQYRKYYGQFQESYFGGFGRNNPRRSRNRPSGHSRREQHQDYRFSGFSGFFNPPPRFTNTNPQPVEARRWYQQAKYDLEAAMRQNNTTSHEWTCYIAHQVAEKAIKACLFSKDFNKKLQEIHELTELSKELDGELKDLAQKLQILIKSVDSTRYPFSWSAPTIPHDGYSKENADEAIKLATLILRFVKEKCCF